MGIFGGRRDEHHELNCPVRPEVEHSWLRKDYRGKVNPMGWGSDEPRTVKRADANARSQKNAPTEHGSRMNVVGGQLRSSGGTIRPAGEKPGGGRQR